MMRASGCGYLAVLSCGVLVTGLAGCGSSEDTTTPGTPVSVTLNGAVQKGPLVLGSTVSVSPLDPSGQPTGQIFNTQTTSDLGEFEVRFAASGNVALEGSGFYYNEVTGGLSTAPITLRALYGIAQAGTQAAYVNLVTHLTYARAQQLTAEGAELAEAAAQAESELQAALGIGPAGLPLDARGIDMNVNGGDTLANAYLFAVSAVVAQAAVSAAGSDGSIDATLQELVNKIGLDFGADGSLTPPYVEQLETAEQELNPEYVASLLAQRLEALGSAQAAPDLNRVLDTDADDVTNADDTCRWISNPDQQVVLDEVCVAVAVGAGEAAADENLDVVALGVGDLDGDGDEDVVYVTSTGALIVLDNDGGVLEPTFTGPPVTEARFVLVADFDGNGQTDIFVMAAPETAVLLPGSGSTSAFGAAVNSTIGSPFAPQPLDVDDDGDVDLWFGPSGGSADGTATKVNGSFAINDGQGHFTSSPYEVVAEGVGDTIPMGPVHGVADLDGNGAPELVFGGQGDPQNGGVVGIVTLSAPATVSWFGSLVIRCDAASGEARALLADVNADAHADLLVATQAGIDTWLGNADGTFAGSAISSSVQGASHGLAPVLSVADFTGDGIVDVVAPWASSSGASSGLGIQVLAGRSDGTFTSPTTRVAVVFGPDARAGSPVTISDLNGDNRADLLVGMHRQSTDVTPAVGAIGALLMNP